MEEGKHNDDRDEIFSKAIRAGKRTYFFDVKATKSKDHYLTITESKRRQANDGKFFFEKHKLFLYKEDFEKFADGLEETVTEIRRLNGNLTPTKEAEIRSIVPESYTSDLSFEDLENDRIASE